MNISLLTRALYLYNIYFLCLTEVTTSTSGRISKVCNNLSGGVKVNVKIVSSPRHALKIARCRSSDNPPLSELSWKQR